MNDGSDDITPEDIKDFEAMLRYVREHVPLFGAEVNAVVRERWRSGDPRTPESFAKRLATGLALAAMADAVREQIRKDMGVDDALWARFRSMVIAINRRDLP